MRSERRAVDSKSVRICCGEWNARLLHHCSASKVDSVLPDILTLSFLPITSFLHCSLSILSTLASLSSSEFTESEDICKACFKEYLRVYCANFFSCQVTSSFFERALEQKNSTLVFNEVIKIVVDNKLNSIPHIREAHTN